MQDLHEPFEYFAGECQRLGQRYRTVRELFIDDPSVHKVLNGVASAFFVEVFNVYQDEILLSIARLSDGAKFGADYNLTIARFYNTMKRASKTTDRMTVARKALSWAEGGDLKKLRHKYLAHLDEKTIVGAGGLSTPDWGKIREFMVNLQIFVDELSSAIGINQKYHLVPALRSSHAAKLLRQLYKLDLTDAEPPIMSSKQFFKV